LAQPRYSLRRRAVAVADPLLHAAVAAAVVAPLVPRAGRAPLLTGVAAGTLIDIDHPISVRSFSLDAILAMETRPRSHCLLATLGAGALGAALGGRVHGWAAFAGLGSHLLRDAGGDGAPTPLYWPFAPPPRRLPRGWATAGSVALALGSWQVSRAATGRRVPASSGAAGGGAA
jgi:LexA-binding, inner membrane-associated putative hydrolase